MADQPPRRVLVSGSTGLIGRRLVNDLREAGDVVTRLTRAGGQADAIVWDPLGGRLRPEAVSGFDAVVHLAGEPLADARWTAEKKQRIADSRVRGTATLAAALASAEHPPAVFVGASAIGYYGERGDTVVDETSPPGRGFLADLCQQWEAAAQPLLQTSRVVHPRIGVVLAKSGGALAAMLPLFRKGLGGPIAGGGAYLSWISARDTVHAIRHLLDTPTLTGPVNLVAPEPVTNRTFTAALGSVLHRPTLLPTPAWLLRLAVGEMAEEALLVSTRVLPRQLLDTGFRFVDPTLRDALVHELGPA